MEARRKWADLFKVHQEKTQPTILYPAKLWQKLRHSQINRQRRLALRRKSQNIGKALTANKLWQTSFLLPPEHCPGGNLLKLQKLFGSNSRATTTCHCNKVQESFSLESEAFSYRLPHIGSAF